MPLSPQQLLQRMTVETPCLAPCAGTLEKTFVLLRQCFANGGKLLLCGNGGSAADCDHMVGELMKGFLLRRPVPASFAAHPALEGEGEWLQGALPAIALTGQSALTTAFSNDVRPEMAFAQQVYGYGRPGDVLLGLSTSGNSKNVCHALRVARAAGMQTVGFTGESGGAMAALCDLCLRVPARDTYRVQELTIPLYHTLCAMLEAAFFEL